MDKKEKVRKQYKKPQIKKVKLETEEVVLAGCKATVGGAGKWAGASKHGYCHTPPCKKTIGS